MKKLLLLLSLALVPACCFAQEGKAKADETELGKTMETISRSWRKLRRQAADATQNEASLAAVAEISAAANKALTYTPDLAKDVPGDKRDAFIAGYQTKMKEMIAALGKLEALIKAGDNPAAVELISKISALQKEGHKEYKRPE